MAKKELPDIESDFKPAPSGISGKISGYSNKLFGIIKLILGICLLPFVYSFSVAFLDEFVLIGKSSQKDFWSGLVIFLIIYLFVWEPAVIYAKGQKLLEIIFNFFKPIVKVAPYLLPIYTIVLFIIYGLLSLVVSSLWLLKYAMFLFGFSIALHLVFSAKAIRYKKGDFLKANYIFGFAFIYMVNVFILALGISLIFKEFSFVSFFNVSFQIAKGIFGAVFKQLFFS
jgi:hypothetical protein